MLLLVAYFRYPLQKHCYNFTSLPIDWLAQSYSMCLHAQEKGLSSFSLVDLPRFVHLLHLSNFWKLLAFLGFALKQKCCIFFPTIIPLFLLPYVK